MVRKMCLQIRKLKPNNHNIRKTSVSINQNSAPFRLEEDKHKQTKLRNICQEVTALLRCCKIASVSDAQSGPNTQCMFMTYMYNHSVLLLTILSTIILMGVFSTLVTAGSTCFQCFFFFGRPFCIIFGRKFFSFFGLR